MSTYEIVYIITNPMIIFSAQTLFNTFLGGEVKNKNVERIAYILYFFLLSSIIFVTRVPVLLLIFNLTSLILISFNKICSMQRKIVFASLIYSILLFIELMVSAFLALSKISLFERSEFNSTIGLILIRTITVIFACLLSRYKGVKQKNFSLPSIYYFAFATVLFGTLYLFLASLENSELNVYNLVVSGAILIIVNMTILIIDEIIYNAIDIKNEKNILEQQNIAYLNQSEIISQSAESIKSLKHDMKNHLLMLKKMYTNNQEKGIEPYIGEILKEIDGEAFSQSNNFVVDSIINFKLNKLNSVDVKINLDINIPQTISILAYDITVILGNLLDNAITAILQSEKKKFNLQINCSMGNMVIFMSNSFNGNLSVENGSFKTTKNAKSSHGIGISNIEKALKNYGGEMRTNYTEDTFYTTVIIPY